MDVADLVHARGGPVMQSLTRLVIFAVLGTALFVGRSWLAPAAVPAAEPIRVTAGEIAALRRGWLAQSGRVPDAAELQALIDDAVDDEVLYREARARELAANDPVVQRRLIQNMRFVGDGAPGGHLVAAAQALGMVEADVVVRRRLIQRMRLALQATAREDEPTDAELHAYLSTHAERFVQPAQVRLSQVFVSRARHGAALEPDARHLLDGLRAEHATPEGGATGSDPLPLPAQLGLKSEPELAKVFGGEFAARVFALPIGEWSGPVPSSYGLHLVWVHEQRAAAVPELGAVRAQVRGAVIAAREQAALAAALRVLRARYAVEIVGAES